MNLISKTLLKGSLLIVHKMWKTQLYCLHEPVIIKMLSWFTTCNFVWSGMFSLPCVDPLNISNSFINHEDINDLNVA